MVLTANEPQNHFLRAQQYLTQGNAKAAAAEARVGAAYLEMQASRAKGSSDQKLKDAAKALRDQAKQIAKEQGSEQRLQQGGQQAAQQLKQSFARANAALAAHFKSLAKRSLENERNVMAAYDLNAAASSLAAAFVWGDKQPEQDAQQAITEAQQLAIQLMASPGEQQQAGQPEDRAQTAAGRIDQKGGQKPANASETIDKLGNAIKQASSAFQSGQQSQQSGQQQQQQRQQEQQQQDQSR